LLEISAITSALVTVMSLYLFVDSISFPLAFKRDTKVRFFFKRGK
jgi:hypothetical protein